MPAIRSRIFLPAGVLALWLITGVPAANGPLLSVASQAPGHRHGQPGAVGGVQFRILVNEEFLLEDGHSRQILTFVEPEALTMDNARAIFRRLSEQYPTEESLGVDILTDNERAGEARSRFGDVLRYPFGNVRPAGGGELPQEWVSADYYRCDLSESLSCYSCPRPDGKLIWEYLRELPYDCEMRVGGPVDLLDATNLGCTEAAERLLDNGLDPNVKAPHGSVPLVKAALWGNDEIVRLLLKRGANVNLASSSGWTALIAASSRSTPLYAGSRLRSRDTIDLLLRHGAAVNARSQDGRTALMFAVRQDIEVVEELLARGADVNAVDGYGKTALSYAEEWPRPEMVELLRRAGAIQ